MNSLLPGNWEAPAIFRKRLGEQAGRQRLMTADGHLLLVLHEAPKPGVSERAPLLLWRDSGGTWRATGSGSGLAELQAHLESFTNATGKLEDQMQEPASAENYFSILQAATPLLRATRNLHRTLQEARELFPDDRNILNARDEAGENERTLELLHSDAKNGVDYMIARRAEEQARHSARIAASSHRLNLLIAIFLPLTALGSAFGMNLRHGFEEVTSPWLFWLVLIAGMAVGFLVKSAISMHGSLERPKGDPTPAPRLKR